MMVGSEDLKPLSCAREPMPLWGKVAFMAAIITVVSLCLMGQL